MKPEWKIFYEDRIRHHTEGFPETAEDKLGIQCVVQLRKDKAMHIIHGSEYYLFDKQGQVWIGIGLNGLEDWTMNLLSRIKVVTKGRAISNGEWAEIYQKAKEDARKSTLD